MVEGEYQRLGVDRARFEAEKQMEEVRIREAQRQIEEEKKKLEEMRRQMRAEEEKFREESEQKKVQEAAAKNVSPIS